MVSQTNRSQPNLHQKNFIKYENRESCETLPQNERTGAHTAIQSNTPHTIGSYNPLLDAKEQTGYTQQVEHTMKYLQNQVAEL